VRAKKMQRRAALRHTCPCLVYIFRRYSPSIAAVDWCRRASKNTCAEGQKDAAVGSSTGQNDAAAGSSGAAD
jgi:hypothetical protein